MYDTCLNGRAYFLMAATWNRVTKVRRPSDVRWMEPGGHRINGGEGASVAAFSRPTKRCQGLTARRPKLTLDCTDDPVGVCIVVFMLPNLRKRTLIVVSA